MPSDEKKTKAQLIEELRELRQMASLFKAQSGGEGIKGLSPLDTRRVFMQFVDSIPDVMFVMDRDLRIMWGNRAERRFWREGMDEVRGQYCYCYRKKRNTPCEGCEAILARDGGEQTRFERKTEDGRLLSMRCVPVKDDQGRVTHVIVLGEDITESARVQKALQESEERFRNLFDNVPVGLFQSSVDTGRLLQANKYLSDLTGYSAEDIGSDEFTIDSLCHDPGERKKFLQQLLENGAVDNYDAQLKRRDGSLIWIRISAMYNPESRIMDGAMRDVTMLKNAEIALRESQERYALATRAGDVGVWDWDLAKDTAFIDPLVKEILGLDEGHDVEILEDWFELVAPEDRKTVRRELLQHLAGKRKTYHVVQRLRHSNGSIRHFLVQGEMFHDNEGNPIRVAGTYQDVTSRVLAEEEAEMQRRHLTATINTSRDMIFLKDTEFRYLVANDAFNTHVGIPGNQLLGRTDYEFLPASHARKRMEHDRRAMEQGFVVYEDQFRGRWYQVVKQRVEDDSGEVVGLAGVARDITRDKLAEQALKESEEKYRELVENANSIILRMDTRGYITFINEYACSLLGFSKGELIGKNVVGVIVPEVESSGRDLEEMILDIGRNPERYTRNENENIRKDGSRVWINWSNRPVLDNSGDVVELLCIGNDVTDRKRAQEALQRAKDAAEAANRSKSEFLANMSHELRTPLNGVLASMQLLESTNVDSEQKEYIKIAAEAGKNLLTLISDILDFSKVEAGKMQIVASPFSPRQLVGNVLAMFRDAGKSKGIELSGDVEPDLPEVLLGDESRFRQILFNLVGNAVKFTDSGHVRVRAGGVCDAPGEWRLRLSVEDTGIGIPDDELGNIFDPFYQADGTYSRKHGGVGLGLGIVRRLVKLMDGTLGVESKSGSGTTIQCIVPVTVPEEEFSVEPQPSAPVCSGGPYTILVAEDDRLSRFTARRLLEKFGHEVDCVENGLEALQALAEKKYDCVLMDIQMPEMDGMEAVKAIRNGYSGIDPDIPVIALTAHALKGDRDVCLEGGMDNYIPKPLDSSVLSAVLDQTIQSRGKIS